jgi:transcription initiation factor IIE alpha subunit
MGKIDDPMFNDRVVLGRNIVKELVRDYTSYAHGGRYKAAAESLGIKERTLFAYMGGEKKSIPTEVFFSVVNSLGIKPEDFDYHRMSLTDVQKDSVKAWRLANPERARDISTNNASGGIVALEKKTGKDRRDIMKDVREGLYRKYGKDAHFKIGSRSTEYFKKKYGKNWKEEETMPMFEALEKKYGKAWGKIVGANANRVAREKFGQNFQVEYGKIVYGDQWNAVIHAFQWQKENFQGFEKEHLGPLFSVISEAGGYDAIKVVGILLQNKGLSIKELSEKTNQGVNYTRKIIHRLAASGVVHHKSFRAFEPEDDIVYADSGQLRQKAKIIAEENKQRIASFIKENKAPSVGCNCGYKTTFEGAFQVDFHCPNCDSVLDIKEPPKILELVERRMKAK